jgi:hypothetical protein
MITFNCFMMVRKDDGTQEVCVVTSGDFCHMAGRRNPRLAAFREVVGREPKDEAELLSRTPLFHPRVIEIPLAEESLLIERVRLGK